LLLNIIPKIYIFLEEKENRLMWVSHAPTAEGKSKQAIYFVKETKGREVGGG